MQFFVMARTYNVYGGHPTLTLISEFLLGDTEGFGQALSELTITFNFPHSGPPRRTLEQCYENFHANLQKLPTVVFRRQRCQAAIDIASQLMDGKDLEQTRIVSLPLFNAAVAETIGGLELLKRRLTSKDEFNLKAFLDQCYDAQRRSPSTVDELNALASSREQRRATQQAAMSPWEKLGIDWRDFHPAARRLLDDPFFWESSNGFAPHGNDTGADLLASYRTWLRRNPSGDPLSFCGQLIRRWGFPTEPASDLERSVIDDAAVALAFAEVKLLGSCRPAVSSLAREAIQRQRQQAIEAVNWPHQAERLKSLEALEAKLLDIFAEA